MTTDKTLGQKLEQASKELSDLMKLLTQIETKLGIFMTKQDKLSDKLDDHVENCPVKSTFPEYLARLTVLEKTTMIKNDNDLEDELSKLKDDIRKIENTSKKHESIWNNVGKFTFQVIVYIAGVSLAAYLLHFLQLKT